MSDKQRCGARTHQTHLSGCSFTHGTREVSFKRELSSERDAVYVESTVSYRRFVSCGSRPCGI